MTCLDIVKLILNSSFLGIIISAVIGFYFWKKQKNIEIRLDIYKKLISSLEGKLFFILVDSSVTIQFFENFDPIFFGNKELSGHIHQLQGFTSSLYKFEKEFLGIISNWGMFLKEKNLFQIKFFVDEVFDYREYINSYKTYLSSLRDQGVLNPLEFTEEIKNEINNHKKKIEHQNDLLSRSYFEMLNNTAINVLPSLFENKNIGELENINEGDEVEYITSNGIELKKYKETNFQKHKNSLKKKKTE